MSKLRTYRVDTILNRIAKDDLGIATLSTRNSDSLDFHDLSVWQIRVALRRAYQAGRNSASRPTRKGDKT